MATRTKPASKSTAASILGSIGSKTVGKAKSTTPEIHVDNQEALEAISAIINAKQAAKAADSVLKVAEGAFRDEALERFEGRCRKDGTLHTSVRFMGTCTTDEGSRPVSLQLTQTRRCAKMQESEASDPLHSAFGEDFDDLFAPQRTIEIDTSILSDKQIQVLVEKMQESLKDIFDSAVTVNALIVPTNAFFGQRVLDARIRAKADNAMADGYAVPFKASFKL